MTDKTISFNFNNSYITLSPKLFSKIKLDPVSSPKLVIFNDSLAKDLGLNINEVKSKDGISILSGNEYAEGGAYISQAYAGHQFGHFTTLGDGRALLIGEHITSENKRYDIQLKGSGITPYSRRGDGRAALGPMLREYIISEAMYSLGIPTTRSLAVVKTGEVIYRQGIEQGAILARVASSHIRFGTIQYAYNFLDKDELKDLVDYSINRHYPDIKEDKNKYINFLKEVIKSHAYLVAKWQSVGFIHGVMNTDNMTISGETIDYGPCAFMDTYNPNTVFSSIDTQGRYAYKNQPIMVEWNLCRFAESILSLLNENTEKAIKIAQEEVSNFSNEYYKYWITNMRSKLGLFTEEYEDKAIIEDLLGMMEKYEEDFTNTFIALTSDELGNSKMYNSEEFKYWYNLWRDRLKRQPQSNEMVKTLMREYNPSVIPRNHRVEEALEAANSGNYNIMNKLLGVLSKPYDYTEAQKEYSKLSKSKGCKYKTYCGT